MRTARAARNASAADRSGNGKPAKSWRLLSVSSKSIGPVRESTCPAPAIASVAEVPNHAVGHGVRRLAPEELVASCRET
jgi:hypothetical protein